MALKLWSVLSAPMAMRLNSLSLRKQVLDQMTPFVHLRAERMGLSPTRVLGDDDLGAVIVQISDDGVAVEGLVGDQSAESDAVDERWYADGTEAVAGQQDEAHKVAERVGERGDFGGHAALGTAYGLALSPLLRLGRVGGP